MMKIYYSYKKYPDSKRATDWSHAANFFLSIATLGILPFVVELIFDPSLETFLGVIAIVLYIVMYFVKIIPAIENIAQKDYIAQFGYPSQLCNPPKPTGTIRDIPPADFMHTPTAKEIKCCKECGSPVIMGATFCCNCGTKL